MSEKLKRKRGSCARSVAAAGATGGTYPWVVVQAVQSGVVEKQPWYEPSEKLSAEPIINSSMPEEFDTVVVEGANKWAVAAE
jgi:hypothetical protein